MGEKIAVVGLGYVGLPLALLALVIAKTFPGTVGYDLNEKKLALLHKGIDQTHEVSSAVLRNRKIIYMIN